MIFVLDNYDSFTYNLVQYLQQLGRRVEVARNREISVEEVLALRPEALVLSPGPGRPENAGIMPALISAAAGRIPMLGVCLGHQAIGQSFGMEVVHAPRIMHGKISEVTRNPLTVPRGALPLAGARRGDAAGRTGNFGAERGWRDHGNPSPDASDRRHSVPSGVDSDLRRQAAAGELPVAGGRFPSLPEVM